MRIALIADTFPPMRTSGAVQLRDLAREFALQGHDLTVLLPSDDIRSSYEFTTVGAVQVLRLRAPRTKDVSYARRTLAEWIMPYAMARNLKKSPLAETVWEGVVWYSPSIFHAPLVAEIKRQSPSKAYLIIRDIFPEWALDLGLMSRGPIYHFFRYIAQNQYEVADIIGVQSPGNLNYFSEWERQEDSRQLEVLQNWLSAPEKSDCSIQISNTTLSGRKILVYAGNMGTAQDLDILIDLAHRLLHKRDFGFLFVGRGSEKARLKEKVRRLGLDNVAFHPEIEPEEVPALYSQCAAGLVALDQRHKSHNIPGKFISYMQSGMPALAVVNKGNDLASLIREAGVGEVCESYNLDELVTHFDALMQKIEACPHIRENCKDLFDSHFSVSSSVRQITSALER